MNLLYYFLPAICLSDALTLPTGGILKDLTGTDLSRRQPVDPESLLIAPVEGPGTSAYINHLYSISDNERKMRVHISAAIRPAKYVFSLVEEDRRTAGAVATYFFQQLRQYLLSRPHVRVEKHYGVFSGFRELGIAVSGIELEATPGPSDEDYNRFLSDIEMYFTSYGHYAPRRLVQDAWISQSGSNTGGGVGKVRRDTFDGGEFCKRPTDLLKFLVSAPNPEKINWHIIRCADA